MDRMACVDIQALPLQLLLRSHPDWSRHPVVVVDRDSPQGVILWANKFARERRIFPGMRYATGLSLSDELRGGTVSESKTEEAVDFITRELWCFSPRIEPSDSEPGVFWLDASGLHLLYPSLEAWASSIRDELRAVSFWAVVSVGFTRFGSYAAAKGSTRNIAFRSPGKEQAYVRSVPVECLGVGAPLLEVLAKFGIAQLGDFMDLPAAEVRKRFGNEADALYRMAKEDTWNPLNPTPPVEPLLETVLFEWPEENLDRMVFRLSRSLQSLFLALRARHEVFKSVQLILRLEDGHILKEEITPAAPSHEISQLLLLIRLRMDALSFSSGVTEIDLYATGVGVSERQLELLSQVSQQNMEAAQEAFDKIRAEFGNDSIVYARTDEGHLPEARYAWEPLQTLSLPNPTEATTQPLVRRIYATPRELSTCARNDPDGWLIAGFSEGPVEEVVGPQIVSGGWWMREVSRAYHYVRTRSGRWLWIFYDKRRGRWFLHGEVQ